MGMPSGDSPGARAAVLRLPPGATRRRCSAPPPGTFAGSTSRGCGDSCSSSSLVILWWIWQYRTTRQKTGIYPVDSFGGYTTELAGPATLFFMLLTLVVIGFAVVLIVGHLVWGQKF